MCLNTTGPGKQGADICQPLQCARCARGNVNSHHSLLTIHGHEHHSSRARGPQAPAGYTGLPGVCPSTWSLGSPGRHRMAFLSFLGPFLCCLLCASPSTPTNEWLALTGSILYPLSLTPYALLTHDPMLTQTQITHRFHPVHLPFDSRPYSSHSTCPRQKS